MYLRTFIRMKAILMIVEGNMPNSFFALHVAAMSLIFNTIDEINISSIC